jgi:hypothetical protein
MLFIMKLFLRFLFLSLLSINAFGNGRANSRANDFFVQKSAAGMLPINLPRTPLTRNNFDDCRSHIKSVVCLVDPRNGDQPRECLPGSSAYAGPFEELHDHLPPVLQKMFCSLDVIYIEKVFEGTAYAGSTEDKTTTVMGIRKSVLDEGLSLNTWASWKEQLSFGGEPNSYKVSPVLPVIETSPTPGVNSFLYFVVTHEFGHILDFANGLNIGADNCQPSKTEEMPADCAFKENTWGSLSWESSEKVRPESDFANRLGLCFYWCAGNALNPSVIPQVYEDLVNKSQFLSTYASRQAWDDFADSLAYYTMDKHLGLQYVIDTRQGAKHDVMAKMKSPLFRAKYEYLKSFMERTDIKYP